MIAGTEAEYQSDAGSTNYTPYHTLTGELWSVFCWYLLENLPCYNGTALYSVLPYFTDVAMTLDSLWFTWCFHENLRDEKTNV